MIGDTMQGRKSK